jgi:hypothetical protein
MGELVALVIDFPNPINDQLVAATTKSGAKSFKLLIANLCPPDFPRPQSGHGNAEKPIIYQKIQEFLARHVHFLPLEGKVFASLHPILRITTEKTVRVIVGISTVLVPVERPVFCTFFLASHSFFLLDFYRILSSGVSNTTQIVSEFMACRMDSTHSIERPHEKIK